MLENLHTLTLGIALILDAKKDGFATFLRKVKHTKSLNSERADFRYELSATEAQNKTTAAVLKGWCLHAFELGADTMGLFARSGKAGSV